MSTFQRVSLFALRISIGWMFFYAGITKVMDSSWSAAGYLNAAKTFHGLYAWLASANMLPFTNFVNEWGLTVFGALLILGVMTRLSSFALAGMMALYYLPILDFPYPNSHAFIVDEHIVYIGALLVLAAFRAGRVWGLEVWCSDLPICKRYPKLRALLG